MKTSICTFGLVTLAVLALAGSAQAQFGKLSDFDPTNKNSGINKVTGNAGTKVLNGVKKTGRDFDSARLDMMDRNPRAGRDYTKLYFKNSSNQTLYVAVRFMPFSVSNGESELKSLDAQGNGWETKAWFKLSPGETKHVGNTNNMYVYYYAEGGGLDWKGQHFVSVRDGNRTRSIGMRSTMVGIDTPEGHTVNLQQSK